VTTEEQYTFDNANVCHRYWQVCQTFSLQNKDHINMTSTYLC
jgi:hypothetical protein